ncbi:ABC transporter [Halorubrum distributum JCM 9100]|uniref:ABC transporter n=5 Tax=Halorubrum distributum TaxID=29283 RepID=M0EMH2_9EURY|nr:MULTISPECIES: ABC transporter permease [Halorubrum distributum group]PHQ47569.1 ABC transporter permease [Halorubrum sp. C3]ELZ34171.1 ABC transporter [Halorubrum terrestre JCM 10247]ELZ48082.1 ABC transporter [Halorubrum distributum JCM 9100]ELZ54357.1 ABC transporter [Halorubrum distributum JCM 10118]EMA61733.1 ABC transporter [Halorubrum litoreum JCM 13561]
MSLGRFAVKRSLQGIGVVWGVVTVVFALRFVTPGSPINAVAPLDASQETRQAIAAELGLDQPLYVQYLQYIFDLLRGDMGFSYIKGQDVVTLVFGRLPATIELAVAASVVAIILAIPLGVISATRRNEPVDYGATLLSLGGISTPNFWLGIMLILVFAVEFNIFNTSGRGVDVGDVALSLVGPEPVLGTLLTWLAYITLPAIALGTYFMALITRLTRSGMLDELSKGYVQAARAKGLPQTLIRYKHALRNTLIPVITVLGLQLGTLIGGAVITEAVFSWPGLGSLVIDSINDRDWPTLQGSLIVIGTSFVFVNILVDVVYAYLDPEVVND